MHRLSVLPSHTPTRLSSSMLAMCEGRGRTVTIEPGADVVCVDGHKQEYSCPARPPEGRPKVSSILIV